MRMNRNKGEKIFSLHPLIFLSLLIKRWQGRCSLLEDFQVSSSYYGPEVVSQKQEWHTHEEQDHGGQDASRGGQSHDYESHAKNCESSLEKSY